ncbi:hypothetical protein CTI14_49780, partial [Methylobacterium radiotolerans]
RAKQLETEGERGLAQQVARLAKPTVSAWAADALALRGTELLERVVDLGARSGRPRRASTRTACAPLAKERALMLPRGRCRGARPRAGIGRAVRAKQLETEGERGLAQQVARLAKPTVSAWAADAL